jgi:DNA-binding response OmpR family regulator
MLKTNAAEIICINAMTTNKPTVLIIEDDIQVSDALERFLRIKGFDVTVAESHGEARGLTDTKFDVIVSDIDTPQLKSGIAWAEELRAGDSVNKDTPILFHSGGNYEKDTAHIDNSEFIAKGESISRLVSHIKDIALGTTSQGFSR